MGVPAAPARSRLSSRTSGQSDQADVTGWWSASDPESLVCHLCHRASSQADVAGRPGAINQAGRLQSAFVADMSCMPHACMNVLQDCRIRGHDTTTIPYGRQCLIPRIVPPISELPHGVWSIHTNSIEAPSAHIVFALAQHIRSPQGFGSLVLRAARRSLDCRALQLQTISDFFCAAVRDRISRSMARPVSAQAAALRASERPRRTELPVAAMRRQLRAPAHLRPWRPPQRQRGALGAAARPP